MRRTKYTLKLLRFAINIVANMAAPMEEAHKEAVKDMTALSIDQVIYPYAGGKSLKYGS